MNESLTAASDAAAIKAATAFSGLGWMITLDAPLHIIGVPVNVLMAAVFGALLGVINGKPMGRRRDAIAAVAINAFVAAAVTAIVPHIPLFKWLGSAPAAAIALVLAFAARWAIPAAIERIPTLVERFLGKRQEGGK